MNRPGGRGSTQHTVSGQQWQGTTFQESTHEIKGLESSCGQWHFNHFTEALEDLCKESPVELKAVETVLSSVQYTKVV